MLHSLIKLATHLNTLMSQVFFSLLCWEKTPLQSALQVLYSKVQKPSTDERPLNSRSPLLSPTTLSANWCWHFAHVVSIKNVWMYRFLLFLHKRGHGSEMPSSASIPIVNKIVSLSHSLLWQRSAVSRVQLILAWGLKVNCHGFGCQQV